MCPVTSAPCRLPAGRGGRGNRRLFCASGGRHARHQADGDQRNPSRSCHWCESRSYRVCFRPPEGVAPADVTVAQARAGDRVRLRCHGVSVRLGRVAPGERRGSSRVRWIGRRVRRQLPHPGDAAETAPRYRAPMFCRAAASHSGALLFAMLLGACGLSSTSQRTPLDGKDPTPLAKCRVAASQSSPLVTEWPASEKAHLESQMTAGAVVVSYSGCELRVLPECRLAGRYEWQRTSLSDDIVEIRNEDDLYAKLPLGAATLEGELRSRGRLSVRTTVAGQLRLAAPSMSLAAECGDATHVVAGMSSAHSAWSRVRPPPGAPRLLCRLRGWAAARLRRSPSSGSPGRLRVAPKQATRPRTPAAGRRCSSSCCRCRTAMVVGPPEMAQA